jgi:hypothetical protein
MKLHDKSCQATIAADQNMVIPWLLMASYAYYCLDDCIISDGLYDTLCKEALLKWDDLDHHHKHLITKDALLAGSLCQLKDVDYPSVAKGATEALLAEGEKDE